MIAMVFCVLVVAKVSWMLARWLLIYTGGCAGVPSVIQVV